VRRAGGRERDTRGEKGLRQHLAPVHPAPRPRYGLADELIDVDPVDLQGAEHGVEGGAVRAGCVGGDLRAAVGGHGPSQALTIEYAARSR